MKQELAQLPTLYDCVHCGLCLPVCPTFHLTGREVQSPRGRIAALRAVGEGRTTLTTALRGGLEDCLVCRACESACPSGISMEQLMAGYREASRGEGADLWTRWERWFLAEVIAHPHRLRELRRWLRVLGPWARRFSLPWELPQRHRLRPPAPLAAAPPRALPARGHVVILRGCIADEWFRAETLAAARVLARNGWAVRFSSELCCGALHRHAGLREESRALARRGARALLRENPDAVIVDAAGCAAALAEPDSDDAAIRALAEKVIDTVGLLDREGWTPPARRLAGNWVVAPPCHQRHGPLGGEAERRVLAETLECGYRELPAPDFCCGAAGLFVLRRRALSRALGQEARRRFEASGAGGVIVGNPGCQLRWEALLEDGRGTVFHPVVALERAYEQT